MNSGFFAFRPATKDRPLDNWFLASKKGCPLIRSFCKEHNRFWAENIFSNQNSEMREAIIRYFPRILRKKEHETTIWVSYFARKVLRVYPYHIFGYHFAYHLATNKVSRKIFEATPHVSSDIAHIAQNLSRQNTDLKVIREAISKAYLPIQKLTWKEHIFSKNHISELDYLNLLFQNNL